MVLGLPSIEPPQQVCERCLVSKQSRNSFKTHALSRATRSLAVVHSDVYGPLENPSLGGNRYFVTFVDEFTRKLWIYLIKEKSEVFIVFTKFCALAERQSGHHLRVLRTDGGGEYNSREYDTFYEERDIDHWVTAPYTPQHNGLAERRNRTLLDMARSMLKGKEMPNSFWGEAVTAAAFILNSSPTKRMKDVTPEEAWSDCKPSVRHFRIFGSICHRHIPDERRKKLDDKSEALILVRYHPTGAYKLYNPVQKRIVINRDVVVDEKAKWDWNKPAGSGVQIQLECDEPVAAGDPG